jgi:hypothetical protein
MTVERPAPAAGTRRQRLLEVLLLLAAAVLFWRATTLPVALAARTVVAGAPPAWLLPLDDAYIFVRYAQQAARGLPWQWNRGEPSTGASSALFPWLLVPVHWGSAELAAWSRWSRLVGVASLWALGLAGARALRAARLPPPWPLAGALCLVWSGPVGWGAVAGMESAANAALLVLACALWSEWLAARSAAAEVPRPLPWGALLAAALLPLSRPENAALTLLVAAVLAAGLLRPAPRWMGLAVLLPGALLMLCDRLATGAFEPAGAIAKSWLGLPFLPLAARVHSYLLVTWRDLLPVYLGSKPTALWPPVGWLAAATAAIVLWQAGGAAWRARAAGGTAPRRGVAATGVAAGDGGSGGMAGADLRAVPARAGAAGLANLAPLALAWLVLVALAPFSILLLWQEMRHHHGALALAWVLAMTGAGHGVEWIAARRRSTVGMARGASPERVAGAHPAGGRRWRLAVLAAPLALLLAVPHWALEMARATAQFYHGHARAAAWLGAQAHGETLLLSDAGLLALAHDGPAIDLIGLGSPDLTEASANGPGALVESLARRRPLPEIAALDPFLLHVPELLGEPLLPGPPPLGEVTLLARVRRELLAGTRLTGRGLDFAYLPDERRFHLLWQPPPLPPHSTVALLLASPPEPGGAAAPLALQGCRPLFGRLGVELPGGLSMVRLRAAVLAPAREGDLLAAAGGPGGLAAPGDPRREGGSQTAPPITGRLAADRWTDLVIPIPPAAAFLWLERGGAAVPCLESLRF